MFKCTQLSSFLTYLLDDEKMVQKAGEIIPAIWKARSARMSDIARAMLGNEARNYKCLQRFLEKFQPEESLLRLFRE